MSAQAIQFGAANANSQSNISVVVNVNASGSNWEGQPTYIPNIGNNPNSIWDNATPFATINGKVTIAVPTGAAGYILETPTAFTGTVVVATSNTDTGMNVHPQLGMGPVYFDTVNSLVPANMYVSSNTAQGGFRFRWL